MPGNSPGCTRGVGCKSGQASLQLIQCSHKVCVHPCAQLCDVGQEAGRTWSNIKKCANCLCAYSGMQQRRGQL